MPKPTDEQFETITRAYQSYVAELLRFADAMGAVGVRVRNVEPFANFAEIIAAFVLGGEIQPPATKGFDLKTEAGVKIQVKSLRVSRENPTANGLDWRACTREYSQEGRKIVWGDRIDAHRLAVVVFYDFWPYALIDFPIESWEKFPSINVLGLGYRHVQKLIERKTATEGTSVQVVDLQGRLRLRIVETPPAAPARGD